MSKRKEPEGAPAAAGAAPPPPRLGDHSSYMPEPLLVLADVRIKVQGGATLLAHTMTLVLNCGALARSSELFVGASAERPAALSAPFDEYAEADVARFLKCIYTAAGSPFAAVDAARPAVVHLAHALDAASVLNAARRRWVEKVRPGATFPEICEADELAALCGWEDVRAEGAATLVEVLQEPLDAAATPAQQALSDVDAFDVARNVIDKCSPELSKLVFGTLAANFRRLHAKASVAARDSALNPAAAAAAALASTDGAAIEVDGRFVAALIVPDDADDRSLYGAVFQSHGLEWDLLFLPNGKEGDDTVRACVGLKLLGGWPKKVRYFLDRSVDAKKTIPKTNQPANQPLTDRPRLVSNRPKVRYQLGLVNLAAAALLELAAHERVFIANFPVGYQRVGDQTAAALRDPAAGWVARGYAAPFVRILEVRDPTPEEVAADEARRAANL